MPLTLCASMGCGSDAKSTSVAGSPGGPTTDAARDAGVADAPAPVTTDTADAASGPDATVYVEPIPRPATTCDVAPLVLDACTTPGAWILADADASALLADATDVYYGERGAYSGCAHASCGSGGVVARVPRCGGPVEVLIPGQSFVTELVDGGSVVYAIIRGPDTPSIQRIDKVTGALTLIDGCASAAATTATTFYFADACAGSLRAVAHDAVDPVTLAALPAVPVNGLAVTADYLFYAAGDAGYGGAEVVRYALADGSTTVIHQSTGTIFDLLTDDTALLIGENAVTTAGPGSAATDGQLLELDLDGTNPRTLVALQGQARLDVDGTVRTLWWQGDLRSLAPIPAPTTPPMLRGAPEVYDVEGGVLFWTARGYILTKPASDERAVTPFDASANAPLRRFDTTGAGLESFREVVALPNGGFATTGSYLNGSADFGGGEFGTDKGGIVAVYDDAWALQWLVEFPWSEQVQRLRTDASGSVYVSPFNGPPHKLARADGSLLGALDTDRARRTVTVTPDGNLVVEATDGPFPQLPRNAVVEVYDDALALSWTRPVVEGTSVEGRSDARGALYLIGRQPRDITGALSPPIVRYTGFLLKLSPEGEILWQRDLPRLLPAGAATAPDGSVTLVGHADGWFDVGDGTRQVAFPGRDNVALARFDADGSLQWVRSFETQSEGARFAMGPEGRLYVVGSGVNAQQADFVALDPSAPRVDDAYVATIGPDGSFGGVQRVHDAMLGGAAILTGGSLFAVGGTNDEEAGVIVELGR